MCIKLKKHLYDKDLKKKYFLYGPWVEEPDEVQFKHAGMECLVARVCVSECNDSWFGGHLCGYVFIHGDHPLYECKDYPNLNIHGGITFCDMINEKFAIGFDCGHLFDIIPSFKKIYDEINKKIEKDFLGIGKRGFKDFSKRTYRDINFVINQCKFLAKQLKNVEGEA